MIGLFLVFCLFEVVSNVNQPNLISDLLCSWGRPRTPELLAFTSKDWDYRYMLRCWSSVDFLFYPFIVWFFFLWLLWGFCLYLCHHHCLWILCSVFAMQPWMVWNSRIDQAGHKLVILLPLPTKSWDYLYATTSGFFSLVFTSIYILRFWVLKSD